MTRWRRVIAPDFTHAAFADLAGDGAGAEGGARREGHDCQGRTSESYRRQDDAWGVEPVTRVTRIRVQTGSIWTASHGSIAIAATVSGGITDC